MDALPLPPRPDLEHYRKRAKELVGAASSTEPDAVRVWAADWLEALARSAGPPASSFVQESFDRAIDELERRVRQRPLTLGGAQLLLARAHGFATWSAFAGQVERVSHGDPFERAADAVVTGDLAELESLLGADPELIRARSSRAHRATLLHYVAANGVEDFRQVTPPNAVAVARTLLEAGAEVDALADTYGGGTAQTTLNLLVSSIHPAEAGLQPALVETLLDFGAAVDGVEEDGSPLMTALAFGYVDAAETLARRGARLDNVLAAAALGRVDLVERILADGRTLSPSLVRLPWLRLTNDPASHLDRAFVWACTYGRSEVVELLLARDVDVGAADPDGMTGLHWAAANGRVEVVRLLTDRGAPLEARNRWGGTVLDSTVFLAARNPAAVETVELLLAAGADVRAVDYPSGDERIDEVLARHGARQDE